VKLGFQPELHEWENKEAPIGTVELTGESGISARKQTINTSPETPARLLGKFT
jgi:hypothetical protein